MTLLVTAPPFFSHFRPMLAIAEAAYHNGAKVVVATSAAFADEVRAAGLEFRLLEINKNSNVPGQSTTEPEQVTRQERRERQRLQEFIEASAQGPVETLITQGRHRLEDMLANPEELYVAIGRLWDELQPDCALTDQLSYGVSLAMHLHGFPFVAYCPPHPTSVPLPGHLYSVPPEWPSCFSISAAEQEQLETLAAEVEVAFRERLAAAARSCGHPDKAPHYPFERIADRGVIYNYPAFSRDQDGQTQHNAKAQLDSFYAGYSFVPAQLPTDFDYDFGAAPTVLVTLGTFLSRRHDVIEHVAQTLNEVVPEYQILTVASDESPEHFQRLQDRLRGVAELRPFVPQEPILSQCDLVVHHGGVGSFTEALYHGVPMIALPFSSDQFSVARDVEKHALGASLDPNRFGVQQMSRAIECTRSLETREACAFWSSTIRNSGGPEAASRRLIALAQGDLR